MNIVLKPEFRHMMRIAYSELPSTLRFDLREGLIEASKLPREGAFFRLMLKYYRAIERRRGGPYVTRRSRTQWLERNAVSIAMTRWVGRLTNGLRRVRRSNWVEAERKRRGRTNEDLLQWEATRMWGPPA